MANEFIDKTACITGASRGIGAATAIALARSGVARLILHYNSHREGIENTLNAVREAGAQGEVIQADLTTNAGIQELAGKIGRDGAGGVDILVNNAGALIRRARLAEYTEPLFDEVMNLNVKSVWFLSQAVVPHMMRRAAGTIINVSSVAARNGGSVGVTVYAAAKAAISTMTKGMARELAPHGIRVNAVSPGVVDNHFHELASTRQMLDAMVASTPAGRLGTNEEIADAVVFLCSDASRYMYGQTLELNGGMYMI